MSQNQNKRSIYLSDVALDYLADAPTLSSRLVGIVLRYRRLVADATPGLSRNQWLAICEANNGTGIHEDLIDDGVRSAPGLMLWANLADSADLGDKWEIDQDALVQSLREMSPVEQAAVYEVVRAFWLHSDLATEEALQQAGARLTDP